MTYLDFSLLSLHYVINYAFPIIIRSFFSWEWYIQDVTTHDQDKQPVQLCACVGANNALAYEEETGLDACSQ